MTFAPAEGKPPVFCAVDCGLGLFVWNSVQQKTPGVIGKILLVRLVVASNGSGHDLITVACEKSARLWRLEDDAVLKSSSAGSVQRNIVSLTWDEQ